MKTKFLLLWILLCFPLLNMVANAQVEKTFKVHVTDLPEGLDPVELRPVLVFEYGNHTMYYGMNYNFDEQNPTYECMPNMEASFYQHVSLMFDGDRVLSLSKKEWTVDMEQSVFEKEFSAADLVPTKFALGTDGFTFSSLGIEDDKNSIHYYPVVENPDQLYFVEKGTYTWQGILTRNSDGTKLYTKTTLDYSGNGQMLFDVDLNKFGFIKMQVEKPEWEDVNQEELSMRVRINQKGESTALLDINVNEQGVASCFISEGDYDWNLKPSVWGTNINIVGHNGSFSVKGGETINQSVSFDNYRKTTVKTKGLEKREEMTASFSLYDASGSNLGGYASEENGNFVCYVYAPENKKLETSCYILLDGNQILSQEQKWISGETDEIVFDYSNYRLVKFECQGKPVSAEVYEADAAVWDNAVGYGDVLLLPSGDYRAEAYWDGGISLKQNFTVASEDMTMVFDFNPDDYVSLDIHIINGESLPGMSEDNYYSFNVKMDNEGIFYGDLRPGEGDILRNISRKKGKSSYELILYSSEGGPTDLCIPLRGEIDLTQNGQTLTLDMNDFCIVPVTVQNKQGEVIPTVNVMLDDEAETLDYLEVRSDSRLIIPKGEYDLAISSGGYALLEQHLSVKDDFGPQVWVMAEADSWPLIIIPYSEASDPAMATVTVQNLGSYDVDGDYVYGNFKPFMAVPAGSYEVTITAQGYKTVHKTIVVNADAYSEEDGAIYYEIEMIPEGTGIDQTHCEEAKPQVSVSGGCLSVVMPSEARIAVYTLQGIPVWQGQGSRVTTTPLQAGVYVVSVQTAGGMQNIKVSVGR